VIPEAIGPYRVQGVLGQGGMGAVFAGVDPRTGAQVAIKTLRVEGGARERERLGREYEALRALDHPGVVRVLGAGEQAGMPWFAMERIEGSDLESRLRAGPLPIPEVNELVVQLSAALEAVHQRGLLHRDLKPENVLCGQTGRFVLTDFGLTKDLEVTAEVKLSKTGQVQGTPRYWAPEQARGEGGHATRETDIYGLGAVIYAALTGRPPVDGATWLEVAVATQESRPPAPESLRPETPPALSKALLRALSKAPEERFPSAAAFAEAALGSAGSASGPGASPLVLALGLVGLAALVGLGAFFATRQASPPPAESLPASSVAPAQAPSRATLPKWFVSLPGEEAPPLPSGLVPDEEPQRYRQAKDGSLFAWVPPGTFRMGAVKGLPPPNRNEFPSHQVTLTRGFFLGIHEISRAKFAAFCREKGAREGGAEFERDAKEGLSEHPAEVRWAEARDYAGWIGGRLPTEAEWAYAAKGGEENRFYPWGKTLPSTEPGFGGQGRKMVPVDVTARPRFAARWGQLNMGGNVAEWVQDAYQELYPVPPHGGERRDPPPLAEGPAPGVYVARGGSYTHGHPDLGYRSSCRFARAGGKPNRLDALGFRVLIEAPR
jgi:serine/threonine protein kinase